MLPLYFQLFILTSAKDNFLISPTLAFVLFIFSPISCSTPLANWNWFTFLKSFLSYSSQFESFEVCQLYNFITSQQNYQISKFNSLRNQHKHQFPKIMYTLLRSWHMLVITLYITVYHSKARFKPAFARVGIFSLTDVVKMVYSCLRWHLSTSSFHHRTNWTLHQLIPLCSSDPSFFWLCSSQTSAILSYWISIPNKLLLKQFDLIEITIWSSARSFYSLFSFKTSMIIYLT